LFLLRDFCQGAFRKLKRLREAGDASILSLEVEERIDIDRMSNCDICHRAQKGRVGIAFGRTDYRAIESHGTAGYSGRAIGKPSLPGERLES
jgi:hypothetical protein